MSDPVPAPFQLIGHRGAAARAPENTIASLRTAVEAGADQVEFDVSLTRDGRAALLHDATLDRTTDGRGPVRRRVWRDLEALDAGRWFARRFAGEPIPDLDAALAVLRGRVGIVVEIKASSKRGERPGAPDRRLLRAVLEALGRTGGPHGVTISSVAWPLLAEARALDPALDLALTVGSTDRRDPIAWAREIGATALHPSRRVATAGFIGAAREAGLRVFPYTVNDARELDRLLAAGADGVFTDDPGALRRLVGRRRPRARPSGPFFLGIDQGSGGTRAVVVDGEGALLDAREVRLGSRRGRDGTILQDADAVVASVVRAAGPLLDGPHGPRLVAAGIAAQRSSLVVWRRADGSAVTPVYTWRVGRTFAVPPRALAAASRVSRTTGLTVRFPYGALRLAEVAANAPEIARGLAEGTLRAGPLGAYVATRLRGAETAVDPSLAQRMLLLDLDTLDWSRELASLFDLPLDALPQVLPSAAHRGSIRIRRRRVPLLGLVGDVGAAARATLEDDLDRGLLVLGTGGFVVVPTGSRRVEVPGLLTTILSEDRAGSRCAVEGTVHGLVSALLETGRRAGSRWTSPELIASVAGTARRSVPVVADIEGIGTPEWDLTPRFEIPPGRHGTDAIVRGALEAIAGRFEAITRLIARAGRLPRAFVATGGLAFSPHLVRAVAAATGIEVSVDPRPHRTAVGAALIARDAHGA